MDLDGCIFGQTTQAIVESPSPKRQDRPLIDVLAKILLTSAVKLHALNIGGEGIVATSATSSVLSRVSTGCACIACSWNCVATKQLLLQTTSRKTPKILCLIYETSFFFAVAIMIKVTSRHTMCIHFNLECNQMPAIVLHRQLKRC